MFFKLIIHFTSGETNSDIKFFTALEGAQFLEELGCEVKKSTTGEIIYSVDSMTSGLTVTDAFATNTSLLTRLTTMLSEASKLNNLGGRVDDRFEHEISVLPFTPARFEIAAEWV